METETLRVGSPFTKDNRTSESVLSGFNIPALIAAMKQSYTWLHGELNAMILLKSPNKQIILTAMHEGTEIESFQSNNSITFQIIEGRLKCQIRSDAVTLNKGQILTLDENVKYCLTTQEDTVFLLTISDCIMKSSLNQY